MQDTVTKFLTEPRLIDVKPIDRYRAKVSLEPLERVLDIHSEQPCVGSCFISMPGCAVTEVAIEGVLHEYSTIEGSQETSSTSC